MEKSFWYLKLAGERAGMRGASVEMERHYTAALQLLTTLPSSPDRDRREMETLLGMGMALLGSRGFADPAVFRAFSRVRELGEKLDDKIHTLTALNHFAVFTFARGQLIEAENLERQVVGLADPYLHRENLRAAHFLIAMALTLQGKFESARNQIELL